MRAPPHMKHESHPEDTRFFVAEADFRISAQDCAACSALHERLAAAERVQRQQDLLTMALEKEVPMRRQGSA
eukprot:10552776-Lingulodinium_polyedra.AAC.1